MRKYSLILEEEKKKIIEHYLQYKSIPKTAEKFDRGYSTIRKLLVRLNVKTDDNSIKPSICIKCKRAAHFKEFPCPWAKSFEAVPGWEAEKVVRVRYEKTEESYYIKKCPLFMPDD
jgi:hypothetical protein